MLTETHDDLVLGDEYHVLATEQRPYGRAPLGAFIVYGTVLPWHTDPGPSGDSRN